MHELFGMDEKATWQMVVNKRSRRQSDEARRRFIERRLARLAEDGEEEVRPVPQGRPAEGTS